MSECTALGSHLGRTALNCLAAVAIAVVAGGCSMPISVTYSPVAATESLIESGRAPRMYVGRFEDVREEKDSIGVMKNSLGGTVKILVTSDNLEMLMAEAATDALRKSGATAGLHGERTGTSKIPQEELKDVDYVLGGRLKTVNVESKPGISTIKVTSVVVIDVCVRKGDKIEWIGPIEGTSEIREFKNLQANTLTAALDKAIGNCMRNMIRHLKASGALKPS